MSYLGYPRLTFSGKFQSDTSTVNNDPRHFSNADFEERFQDYTDADKFNGWWNPRGTGIFRLADCTVGAIFDAAGKELSNHNLAVRNAPDRASAKIVDLDPDWQLASTIYGQQIVVVDQQGEVLLRGNFKPYEFRDLWFTRTQNKSGDDAASATFQSVLTDLVWGKLDHHPTLKQLKACTEGNKLSVRMTTYGFSGEHTAEQFTYGTILGAIGPYIEGEPESFVNARRFSPASRGQSSVPNPNYPKAGITNFSFCVDEKSSEVRLDLSNALPLDEYLRPFSLGLTLAVLRDKNSLEGDVLAQEAYRIISQLSVSLEDLQKNSGIFIFKIPEDCKTLIESHPLALLQEGPLPPDGSTVGSVVIREQPHGRTIRAEKFTHRLDPNDAQHNQAMVSFFASAYGKPVADFDVSFEATAPAVDVGDCPPDPPPGTTSNPAPSTPTAKVPVLDKPVATISLQPCEDAPKVPGVRQYLVQGPDKFGTPRDYLDGQLYTINYNFNSGTRTIPQQFDNLAILVFSSFEVPEEPCWDQIQPVLQQYANLYPIMSRGIFDFSQRKQADANAFIMRFVFNKHIDDPDYMPVTRDLSQGKRKALLNYFEHVIKEKNASRASEDATFQRFAARCPMQRPNAPQDATTREQMKQSPAYSKGRNRS